MPRARGRALIGLAAKVAEGSLLLTAAPTARKCGQPCSPFLASVLDRRLHRPARAGDPDLPADRPGSQARPGPASTPGGLRRPWRSYALMHVWTAASEERRSDDDQNCDRRLSAAQLICDGSALTTSWMSPVPPRLTTLLTRRPSSSARRQLTAYFAGELDEFDLLLAARGSDFQRHVEGARDHPVRRNRLLRDRGRPECRRAASGRRPCQRVEPDRHRRAVPSG